MAKMPSPVLTSQLIYKVQKPEGDSFTLFFSLDQYNRNLTDKKRCHASQK